MFAYRACHLTINELGPFQKKGGPTIDNTAISSEIEDAECKMDMKRNSEAYTMQSQFDTKLPQDARIY